MLYCKFRLSTCSIIWSTGMLKSIVNNRDWKQLSIHTSGQWLTCSCVIASDKALKMVENITSTLGFKLSYSSGQGFLSSTCTDDKLLPVATISEVFIDLSFCQTEVVNWGAPHGLDSSLPNWSREFDSHQCQGIFFFKLWNHPIALESTQKMRCFTASFGGDVKRSDLARLASGYSRPTTMVVNPEEYYSYQLSRNRK